MRWKEEVGIALNVRPTPKPVLEEEDDRTPRTVSDKLDWYDREIKKRPKDLGLRYGKAKLLISRERWEEAREELEEIVKIDADHEKAWESLILVCQILGDHERVLEAQKHLEKERPDDPELLCSRGKTLLILGEYDEAKSVYEKALSIDPLFREAWLGKAEAERRKAEVRLPHEPAPEIGEETAREVSAAYDRVLEMDPTDTRALVGRSSWDLLQGRVEDALEKVDRAVNIDPSSPIVWERKAAVLEAMGEKEEAEALYKKAVRMPLRAEEAGDPLNHLYLGRAWERTGDRNQALRCFERILEIDRNNQLALMKKAQLLEDMGEYRKALETYERLVNLRPDDHYMWYLKGNSHKMLQQFPKAVESYDRSITIKPDFSPALYSKSETLYEMGEFEAALDAVDKLLSLDPEHANGRMLRDAIHQSLGTAARDTAGDKSRSRSNERRPKNIGSGLPIASEVDLPTPLGSTKQRMKTETVAIPAGIRRGERANMGAERGVPLLQRARKAREEGDIEKAKEHYLAILEYNPQSPEVYEETLEFLHQNGDYITFLSTLERCPHRKMPGILRMEIEAKTAILMDGIRRGLMLLEEVGRQRGEVEGRSIPGDTGGDTDECGGESPEGYGYETSRDSPSDISMDAKESPGSREIMSSPGELTDLLKKIELLLAETPDDHILWYARGVVLYKMEKPLKAIQSFQRAIFMDPGNPRYWEAKGYALQAVGREEKAVE
ncbi:MAG: tetratricopeptide repeat protein, partial [Thermoplasmata archaeon]|nr:tetratricopeptide repeat protein [Thermoplasmata archaeon]